MLCITVLKSNRKNRIWFPWRIGIVGFMAYPSMLKGEKVEESIIELAEDPFFDLLELNLVSDEDWEKVKKTIRRHRKEVSSALQPFTNSREGNICSLDENIRSKAVEEVKRMINISWKRGIRIVALSSGIKPGNGEKTSMATENLIKSLIEICKYAKQYNTYVLLETFDISYDKNLLIGPLEDAANVIKRVREKTDNIGLLWDLSHAPMLNEKPSMLTGFKDVLTHVHIGCTKRTGETMKDWHPSFYREGAINGLDELVELFTVLDKIRYRGAVSFEVKPEEGQQTREVIDVSKGILYTAFCKYLMSKSR
ncbi:MAG: sugar phosphate isomerase/epimerase family protein [Thermoproteota archaeon]